jgi:hypothetical protein
LRYDFNPVYYWQFICITDGNLTGEPERRAMEGAAL